MPRTSRRNLPFIVCDHPLLYIVALIAGSVVGALMLGLLKKNRKESV